MRERMPKVCKGHLKGSNIGHLVGHECGSGATEELFQWLDKLAKAGTAADSVRVPFSDGRVGYAKPDGGDTAGKSGIQPIKRPDFEFPVNSACGEGRCYGRVERVWLGGSRVSRLGIVTKFASGGLEEEIQFQYGTVLGSSNFFA